MEQLSLVFFTVLAQAAAGLALVLCGLRLSTGDKTPQATYTKGYILMLILLAIAGIASITHLGQTFRVLNVMGGLAHGSPLSWEIVAVSVFGGAGFVLVLLGLKEHPLAQQPALPIVTALLGLIMVFAISRVYNLVTVDAWYGYWTPLQFFATTLLLGFAIATLLLSFDGDSPALIKTGTIIVIALFFVMLPMVSQFLGGIPGASELASSSRLPIIRLVLLAVGCIFWVLPMMKDSSSRGFTLAGVLCLIGSELAGRAYFYDLINLRVL